nr:uroporphyrinogen decarboxylase 1, chloroplastic-like [Quercus suber]POE54749.1 isoform 2 of uroporphyrinogen decarboxylase 1, chloroplastic [Quercus suber]
MQRSSFRERSETTDLIVEISLEPWKAFHPDGVIIFSDILTPLPAFGVPFDIEEVKGPVIQSLIYSEEGLKSLHPIDLEKLHFVGESLRILRRDVGRNTAVLGFVGALWTIATYIVEGCTTRTYTTIKTMYLSIHMASVAIDMDKGVVKCAGRRGHILNLGHGVLVGTPEEAVAHFFEVARSLKYDTLYQN